MTAMRRRKQASPAVSLRASATIAMHRVMVEPRGTGMSMSSSGSHETPRWRRQSAANPSLKWDFRNNARFRGAYSRYHGVRRLFLVVSVGIFFKPFGLPLVRFGFKA